MNAIRRSVLFSAVDRYLAQILLVVTTAVMARLLTPAETGIFLLANAVIMLGDNFRSFGTGVYIVQAEELRPEMVRSAFTVTLLLSLAMGLVIFLASRAIAAFYEEPELEGLLRIAALGFVAIPFGSPILALLQRELAFNTLAVINIAAAVANAAITIGLGLAGFGASSYVWGFVGSGAVLAVVAFALRPDPSVFRPSLNDVARVVSFGSVTSAVGVINMVSDMVPRLAFGKLLGFDAVGLYGRALTICQLPDRAIVQALQPVVLPAMAARARAGGSLKEAYLRGHALMSALQWPALALLALLADPVVRVLLGAQWGETAPLVRLLALASMALAPAFMTFPVLVATGRVRDTLTASLISLPPSITIVIAAAWFGGLTTVAASLFIVAPLQMVVALFYVRRAIGLSWGELVAASRASAFVTLGTVIVPAALVLLSPAGFALGLGQTIVAIVGAAGGWFVALRLVRHPVEAEIVAIMRMLLGAAGRLRRSGMARKAD